MGGGVEAEVKCTLFANKPNYSGSKLTATGGIRKCTPRPPAACAFEVELQFYEQNGPGPGTWVTHATSDRSRACPPPSRSEKAGASCRPAPKKYSYRTLTYGAIVDGGGTDTGSATSGVLAVKCY
ncbi:hypothetical protein GCM10018785_45210 [Streptomyces longispororuber]|uniref:Uncharacterized protein n=1 Tax=Streptomyces longispororuber TaxID=68230 RepID=A0A918ZV22_9ACTN|nr:hypothetical protein GCM10018785_45210 [Streptomyces longispororuber]